MEKNLSFTFFIYLMASTIFFSDLAFASTNDVYLEQLCTKQGGEIVSGWTCPHSGRQRSGFYCRVKNSRGAEQVYNGCTGTVGSVGQQFFPACVLHDLCYHNEPGVSGKSKTDCDQEFYENMKKICRSTSNSYSCQSLAWTFFQTVARVGNASWNCSKNSVPYVNSLEALGWRIY